jgi:FdrA protein
VVLGHGAESDPAAALAPAAADAVKDRPDLAVVVSLCGTPADPQDRDRQAAALCDAGADVFGSNAQATRHALRMVEGASA